MHERLGSSGEAGMPSECTTISAGGWLMGGGYRSGGGDGPRVGEGERLGVRENVQAGRA